jgi:osmoprotectant transport system permease protein
LHERKIDRVLLSGVSVGLLSYGLKFVIFKENRLVRGEGLFLWQALSPLQVLFFSLPWILAALFLLLPKKSEYWHILYGMLGNTIIVLLFIFIGAAARTLVTQEYPFARTSVGAGSWMFILAAYIIITSAVKKIERLTAWKIAVALSSVVMLAILVSGGALDEISVLKEFFSRKDRFLNEMYRHLLLAGMSVCFAIAIGIPFGMIAFKKKLFGRPIFVFVNAVQTIPSLALFGMMIAPLAILSQRYPFLREIGIKGVGGAPAIIALTLYALLPITRNTYTSLKVIDPAVVESALGMGMSRFELLLRIEIPLSIPIVLSGVRVSMVQAIGNTTVAALIGAGGFGVFVFQGLGQAVPDLILLGALPVIALAIVVDKTFEVIIMWLTPQGIRDRTLVRFSQD